MTAGPAGATITLGRSSLQEDSTAIMQAMIAIAVTLSRPISAFMNRA
jgi:hypothetical protein